MRRISKLLCHPSRALPTVQSILFSGSLPATKTSGTIDNQGFCLMGNDVLPPMGPVRVNELTALEMYNKQRIIIIGVAQILHNEEPVRFSLLILFLELHSL